MCTVGVPLGTGLGNTALNGCNTDSFYFAGGKNANSVLNYRLY